MRQWRGWGGWVIAVAGCSGSSATGGDLGVTAPMDLGPTAAQCAAADGFLPGCPLPGTPIIVGSGGAPIDPASAGSAGVRLDGNHLALDPGAASTSLRPLIWVANSDEGTISKIDTRTQKELARYATGPVTTPGTPDPSRTTVGLSGDVVVANRAGSSATYIASDPQRCVDRNHNGQIDTSTSGTDVRPWGSDECVLWNTPFTPGVLARAAAFDANIGIDGGANPSVWIGLWDLRQMVQLDAATGRVLDTLDVSPVKPYGAAIDRDGAVWVWGGGVARIGTGHVVTHIPTPPCAYGIAVDEQGRVWTSGQGCVARYTPATNHWDQAAVGTYNRGLALDGRGSVWIADTDFGVHRVDENTLATIADLPLPYALFVGIAVDSDRHIWAIARSSDTAVRIDPDTLGTTPVHVGRGPYTYSDMTGFELRNATAQTGTWRYIFDGCQAVTSFLALDLTAATPPGTAIAVMARTAADHASLAAAPWQTLATVPPARVPLPLGLSGATLELRLDLQTINDQISPTVDRISVYEDCLPPIR